MDETIRCALCLRPVSMKPAMQRALEAQPEIKAQIRCDDCARIVETKESFVVESDSNVLPRVA